MSHNTFGHLFRVTTWGESHGPAIGCTIDGCPPGIRFTLRELQDELDRRKPGSSRFVTQRREPDEVSVLSGVLADETDSDVMIATGTPIALQIQNVDQRSKDYGDIARQYRPGHADYAYDVKYGLRDFRGGGRSSARETAMRVAAGAIARKIVPGLRVRGAIVQIGDKAIDRANWDWAVVERSDNPFFTPDAASIPVFETYLDQIRMDHDSVGAIIEVVAENVPAGLGAPLYAKIDSDIAAGLMSINAVKGVEIGDGFASAALRGTQNADEMRIGTDGRPVFEANHAGGVLGGISTGAPIVARFAVKPTSSILTPRRSIDRDGQEIEVVTKGRHDPCVGIRAVPIGEAMVACAIADHFLRHRGQTGRI
ncbi:chorismate synthase [Fulvimarina sp. 2208YS6-2-32]|uniref:Chorismate synthase n=1 Tax=Fulvimarina uroteuthidis TaxID=3098149 RepID=A0ABU5I008_9HYPH|nr:chorismate synthase [Fulvimarina sp. 2208YS6-2-32]MDY8108551.1 chorismate synthase [Fulvimarina sp. 2208YS6-2-32]